MRTARIRGDTRPRPGRGWKRTGACLPVVLIGSGFVFAPAVEAQWGIEGMVFDSTRAQPLEGARVLAEGVPEAPTTDAAGAFRLPVPGPGTYQVSFQHPRLAEVGIQEVEGMPVEVPEEGHARVELAIPSLATIYAAFCGVEPGATAIVGGLVRAEGEDELLPRTVVRARPLVQEPTAFPVTSRSDQEGLYLFCDLVPEVEYELVAETLGIESDPLRVRVPQGQVASLDAVVPVTGESQLSGTVRSVEAGAPLEGASLRLEGPASFTLVTDREGRFRRAGVPAGRYQVRVEHLVYEGRETEVRIPGGGRSVTLDVDLAPEPAYVLEPIAVEVEAGRPTFGPLVDVYERRDRFRQLGLGRFVDREEIETTGVIRLTELVARSVPGAALVPIPGRPGSRFVQFRRATGMIGSRMHQGVLVEGRPSCPAVVYLDGIRLRSPETLGYDMIPTRVYDHLEMDKVVHPSLVEMVEIYRGPSEVPAEFLDSDARCGVIAIWTRRGG